MKLTTAIRSGMANLILNAIDADASAGTMEIYTGAEPSSMGLTIVDTLLGTVILPYPFGTQTNGVVTMAAVTDLPSSVAAGTAGWARIRDGAGAEVTYLTCSIPGGGGQIILNSTAFEIGSPIVVRSGVWTIGGGPVA